MTVLGTRPEIIRLSRIIPLLDKHVDHTLVHTGQNYDHELNQVFFEDLGLRKPDHFLDAAGETAAKTCGNVIARVDDVIGAVNPDAMLVLGDTNSCLAAYAAKRRRVSVFHMEAGNRCFDDRVPEEINRRLVDHISDINLCYSGIAREYLLREGLPPDRIVKTGSPMREVLEFYAATEAGAPIRACVLARPAFRTGRPNWAERCAQRYDVQLGPLEDDGASQLCRTLLRPAENVPAEAIQKLVARTHGVPLQELLSSDVLRSAVGLLSLSPA